MVTKLLSGLVISILFCHM